jgi:hypothetical protein
LWIPTKHFKNSCFVIKWLVDTHQAFQSILKMLFFGLKKAGRYPLSILKMSCFVIAWWVSTSLF